MYESKFYILKVLYTPNPFSLYMKAEMKVELLSHPPSEAICATAAHCCVSQKIDIIDGEENIRKSTRHSIQSGHDSILEHWSANAVFTAYRIQRVEAECREYRPCRHLPAIFVAAQPRRSVGILAAHDACNERLCFVGLVAIVVEVSHMVRRLVAVSVLPNHSSAENRQ